MPASAIYLLSLVFGLTGAILAFIFLVPESKRAKLKHPFWVFLHNLFNFKSLLLEKILKFCYVFSTLASVVMGFFMLFWVEWDEWLGYYGFLVLLIAPITIRIMYEGMMMFILLVQNTININNKIGQSGTEKVATPVAEPEPPKKPKVNFCMFCGNILDENGKCTGCEKQY